MSTRKLAVILGAVLVLLYVVFRTEDTVVSPVPDPPEPQPTAAQDKFGLPSTGLTVVDGTVGRNETFSDLLDPYAISYEQIVTVARKVRPVFDVRRMRSNRPYRIYLSDSLEVPRYFVYEKSRTDYVVFELGKSPSARLEERPVQVVPRVVSGVINESLYQTLVDQDVNPDLANRLSEIFAWQIDFYRIQRGDFFKIIYDELRIDGERVGVGEIHAARFNHMRSDYFAFHYADGDVDDHFDEKGESLRKEFLVAPVKYSRISSGYSGRRFHPVQKRYKSHLGTDYAAPYGTPIRSTGDGVVTEARYRKYNGNYVKIRHNGTYTTGYLHMSKIASGIRKGIRVTQGQIIGFVGHTGLATGNHVCYRFWKNGRQVNHRREKFPSVGPLPDAYRESFAEVRDRYMSQLLTAPDVPFAASYAMLFRLPVHAASGS